MAAEQNTILGSVENTDVFTATVEFLAIGITLFEELRRHSFTSDSRFAEVLVCRSEDYVNGLAILLHLHAWPDNIRLRFTTVITNVQSYIDRFNERFNDFRDDTEFTYECPQETRERDENAGAGRPRFLIPQEQLEGLRSLHFSWNKIAEMLGVSERTIRRRREELGMTIGQEHSYSDIPDDELDTFIRRILDLSPQSGERMVIGSLRSQGVKVQRGRIRTSIGRVDPISRELRRRTAINRRVYSVPTPNALWHIDGNHKLIRWRLVLHGGIDGFSRTIVYLACADNNRADTVHDLFLQATQRFHSPRRVRCDHGTENVAVARWMLRRYGVAANPVITGLSVHNQRIERLWKDVNVYINQYFKNLFYYYESINLLDPVNEIHLLVLHLVYKPRINRALASFIQQWNNHPLSTERNRSPYQVWTEGFYQQARSGRSTVQELLEENGENLENLGIDDEGPTPAIQTQNNVIVPEVSVHLTDYDIVFLQSLFDPLAPDNDHGKQIYTLLCMTLENLMAEREN